jgi:F-type H+-transporting ATPase subunit gamma
MPSIKDLKRRITSVKSTQQTTKAMKLVSAAKLRRAQDAIIQHRPYALALTQLLGGLAAGAGEIKHPLMINPERRIQSVTLVLFTSDRGLCGGFNSYAIKNAQRWIKENASRYSSVHLACVGKRGYEYFKTKVSGEISYYEELGGKVTFSNAKKLSDILIQRHLDNKSDETVIIYNEFINAVSQRPVLATFLPLDGSKLMSLSRSVKGEPLAASAGDGLTIIKPAPAAVFQAVVERSFPVQIYRIMLESQAGEHGARMSAMENATKNAGQMIKKLTLQYNKQRQAGITKELLEIISGSESQASEAS